MSQQTPGWICNILKSEDETVYLLDHGYHIKDCNPAWDRFASANGGVGISQADVRGRFIFDFIPDVLVTFYERKYAAAFRGGKWIGFDYECSSPEVFRLFHMALRPIDNSNLLVVNSYLPNHRSPLLLKNQALPESSYVSPSGYITMCANCRRTQRQEQARIWDFVSRFLRETKRAICHGLCPKCVQYLYPEYEK